MKNVHLRYEDDSTIPGCSFAGGMVIKSLSAHSTDPNWVSEAELFTSSDICKPCVTYYPEFTFESYGY